jgi:hypothetical protein
MAIQAGLTCKRHFLPEWLPVLPPRVMQLKNKKVHFVVDRVIDRMVK